MLMHTRHVAGIFTNAQQSPVNAGHSALVHMSKVTLWEFKRLCV